MRVQNLITQKILLLLLAGATLSICYTPRQYWKAIEGTKKEWSKISKKQLREEIRKLYQSKMISKKENEDGSTTIFLSDKGKVKALTYYFDEIRIVNKEWDGKWRMIIFDIPERIKKSRDVLRLKIRNIGFYELQKSVFVFPHKCENEMNFIIEYYGLRKYVRFGILEAIDNEIHLKKIFGLN